MFRIFRKVERERERERERAREREREEAKHSVERMNEFSVVLFLEPAVDKKRIIRQIAIAARLNFHGRTVENPVGRIDLNENHRRNFRAPDMHKAGRSFSPPPTTLNRNHRENWLNLGTFNGPGIIFFFGQPFPNLPRPANRAYRLN